MAALLFQIPLDNSPDCLWLTLARDQYVLKFPKRLHKAVAQAFDEEFSLHANENHGVIEKEANRNNLFALLNFLKNRGAPEKIIHYTDETSARTSQHFSFLLEMISRKIINQTTVVDVSWFYGGGNGQMATLPSVDKSQLFSLKK